MNISSLFYIYHLNVQFKAAEGRFEYGEMNITKLNQRIDDIEDEIYREKMKIKKVADELGETFDDMLTNYWYKDMPPDKRKILKKDS